MVKENKVVDVSSEIDIEEVDTTSQINELQERIDKMIEDKANKCEAAKEQLLATLDITASKYLTVTGTAEALRVVRFVCGDSASLPLGIELTLANTLAYKMSQEVDKMKAKAESLAYEDMEDICKDFYDEQFTMKAEDQPDTLVLVEELAYEMMRIDLCRNVGGSAEDMVSFINRVDEEIKATQEALEELKDK